MVYLHGSQMVVSPGAGGAGDRRRPQERWALTCGQGWPKGSALWTVASTAYWGAVAVGRFRDSAGFQRSQLRSALRVWELEHPSED